MKFKLIYSAGFLAILIGFFTACGPQRLDPEFTTPEATLKTYWEAKKRHDVDRMWRCLSMNERKRFLEKRFLKKYGRLNPDVAKRMSIEVIDVVVNQDNATMKYAEILKHKEEDKVIRVVHSVDLIREGDGWKIKLLSDEVIKEETLKGKLGSSDSSGL